MNQDPATRSLNPEQYQAVTFGKGPLMIIAGAGTGKTTVITERIKNLIIEKKINPKEILALTFTEKAADEMETRIDAILPYGYSELWIQTFHAFCDRILKSEAIHIGLNPSFDLMTEAESLLFLRKQIFEFDLNYFRPLGNPMRFLRGMLQHFSRLKDDDISPEQYLQFAESLSKKKNIDATIEEIEKTTELANAFKKYEELKTKEGKMDFSDLISNTLKLFRKRENVLMNYQKQFKYILVDEFQDTNFAQNEMAILLSGTSKNITVVGDDDQSIYRWRGAAIANMMQFKSHFPNAEVVTLTKNYRSTQIILDSAYGMIQHNNPDRLEVKENFNKKLSAERDVAGEPVEFLYADKVENEAEIVINKIKDEVKNNNRKYNDFAILVRANDHALPFQRALARKHIPFQFLGPGHLFDKEEIKDLLAYLRVLANYEDSSSLYRVLTMPVWDFDARDIASMLNSSKKNNDCLFHTIENSDTLSLSNDSKKKLTRLVELIKKHLALVPRETAGQILYYFFEDSGLMSYYLDPRTQKTETEAQNIAKFFNKLQGYTTQHEDASVFAVVDWIELSMELGESPMSTEIDWSFNNAVNILTVHSSKGLEFPVVFVVNLVTQRFPSRDRKEQIPVPQSLIKEELPTGDENLQEERRLFYVAMTRARDLLFLTAASFYGDGKKERKISPFLAEALGGDVIDNVLQKKKNVSSAQQLSLLEILTPQVQDSQSDQITKTNTNNIPPLSFISYSSLQTFDICPLHYKLRYIMKLPAAPSPALSFGMSIHALLKVIYQNGFSGTKPLANNTVEELVKRYWLRDGYESRSHEESAKRNAAEVIKRFMRDNTDPLKLPAQTEMPFQFMLEHLKIMGRFDRVDKLSDGKIEIIDYKTGTNIPNEKKLKDDLQLTLYALAASEVNDPLLQKNPEDVLLTLHYVESNTKLTTSRTRKQLDDAKNLILQKVKNIETSSFVCSRNPLCKNCEYKMLCSSH